MKPQTINCPSCGAPHTVHNPGVVMIVCEYCSNAVYWDEEKVKNAGKQSSLPEGFTRLYRGATGRILGRRFVVLGRVRYSFGRGFWDEWYLELYNGRIVWLTEDNHELALESLVKEGVVPGYKSLRVGDRFTLENLEYAVEEKGTAECIGLEGDLPQVIQAGETYPYADASSLDGKLSLGIEYDDEPPTVFRGRWLKYANLHLDDEGMEW